MAPPPAPPPGWFYAASGRAAVYHACRAFREGARIWLPSFNCGVEVDAAIDAGLRVGFFRVREDLAIDEDDLETKLRQEPGPVLAIHYFGFPQPGIDRIARLCESLGAALIEDCAHALFSSHGQRRLGGFGEAAIFSIRKSLPLVDGGAVRWPGAAAPALRSSAPGTYSQYLKGAVRRLSPRAVTAAYRELTSSRVGEPRQEDPTQEERLRGYWSGMSWLSRGIAAGAHEQAVIGARRRNYATLAALLAGAPGYAPVFDGLPAGVCPLVLPVWVDDRATLMRRLREAGIEAYRFGARPHSWLNLEEFPETARPRERILGLPVHQYLRGGALERITGVLAPLLHCNPVMPLVSASRS
jgi:perosamine synthetase